MAYPTLTKKLLILLGDGESSETFAWPCGAMSRSVKFTNNTDEDVVLDCTDPVGEPAAFARWVESQDTSLTISGRVSLAAFPIWRAWADDASDKNIRILLDESLANGGGYWSLAAILQDFEMGSEGKATATFTATIVSNGGRTWTAAAA